MQSVEDAKNRRVRIGEPAVESSPLLSHQSTPEEVKAYDAEEAFVKLKPDDSEFAAAERLSIRLLEVSDDDSEEDRILRESLDLGVIGPTDPTTTLEVGKKAASDPDSWERVCTIAILSAAAIALMGAALYLGVELVGPPNQPVGPYRLVERQEGKEFFDSYTFYEGRDSVGSNGYLMYIGKDKAFTSGLANVTIEQNSVDVFARRRLDDVMGTTTATKPEPFVYMGSSATAAGPRDSIRLEGKRRFNRGLFIIDLRHMPAGCGVWPAFWLTDEANWPVNGEIDIVEGVNYQSVAKTALHSTKGCVMDDIPQGVSTGGWDEAVGIPDKKTGIPDMTLRYAKNCFAYDPHQWLNQGCVAVDTEGDSLGVPVNKQGGGVYALEWDPVNRRMRTWVFSPHEKVPKNLRDAINTAGLSNEEDRVMPDTDSWPLPYGYFVIGDGTSCPASHFKNMHLVFNLAFCGSVAGNRFQLDCPKQATEFNTCNEWIKSEPDELNEAYWKIRGVYVYERSWERAWL